MHKSESLSIRDNRSCSWERPVFPPMYRHARAGWLAVLALALVPLASAQQTEQKQEIPDAPSAVHPPQSFPSPAAETKPAPPNQPPPSETTPNAENTPAPPSETPPPRPPMNITTVPEGGATKE